MLLFCLAHHPAMLETAARHPGTRLVAFADDTKTCGNYDAVPAAIATYTGLYALETNGSINADKSGFYSPEVEEPDVREAIADAGLPDDIAVSRDGVVVVGAPIGTAAFVTKFVKELCAPHAPRSMWRGIDRGLGTRRLGHAARRASLEHSWWTARRSLTRYCSAPSAKWRSWLGPDCYASGYVLCRW